MNKDVTNNNYTMIILLGGINMEIKEVNNGEKDERVIYSHDY